MSLFANSRIVVPIDFSEQADRALETAMQVAANVNHIRAVHVAPPLLMFERTYFAANGEAVEHAVSYQTGRRYPYRVVLSRAERRT